MNDRKFYRLARMGLLGRMDELDQQRCEICNPSGDNYTTAEVIKGDCCEPNMQIRTLGTILDGGRETILDWYEERIGMTLTIEELTVEKYSELKANKATDGAIASMLGTYQGKLIEWKKENGLMGDKTTKDTPTDVQEVVQRVGTSKETNSSSVDYKAEYEALEVLYKEAHREINKLKEVGARVLNEKGEERKKLEFDNNALSTAYNNLLDERNELFDKAEGFKRSHDEGWKKLKSEQAERSALLIRLGEAEGEEFRLQEKNKELKEKLAKSNERAESLEQSLRLIASFDSENQSTAYSQQAEMQYRQLKSRYHALEEELAALQDIKQLSVLLASQYVAASREVVE